MRVVQLIDSLEPGGAERMAVNIANGLANVIPFSGIVATRKEGDLKNTINANTNYLFLNRTSTFDVKGVLRLKKYINQNSVTVIHAHSSSFFIAVLTKLVMPSLKIVWHDHYGKSEFLEARSAKVLKFCKPFINTVITVNTKLEQWSKNVIGFKKVHTLPNFVRINSNEVPVTQLLGVPDKKIVCLANYRPQKDHFNLLKAFELVSKQYTDWTLHLVGKDFEDSYSEKLKATVSANQLTDRVFLYGSKPDISNILSQATIGVLASESEGLPLALLEYGLHKLPVVVTNVGQCASVIHNQVNGLLVPAKQPEMLAAALQSLISASATRQSYGSNLYNTVQEKHSNTAFIKSVITVYEQA